MGYKAEKERKEKIRRRIAWILLAIFFAVVAALTVFDRFVPIESWKYYVALPQVSERKEGELRVHFLDVGEADSALIEFPDGKTMLIDGGDIDADKPILRYLNALKIKRLDYILVTHSDSDHCGALTTVLQYKEVGKVFLPYVQDDVSKKESFLTFSEALEKNDATAEIVRRYTSVTSTDERYPFTFCVLFPYSSESSGNADFYANELSTIAWLDYRGVSTLFCGDTSSDVLSNLAAENELGVFSPYGVDLKSTEILKVPHHGSESGINSYLLEYLGVKKAVISCGRNNYYGHPSGETLAALAALNITTYRTDWRGNILLTVDKNGAEQISLQY